MTKRKLGYIEVAKHEAGHALVACLMGFDVEYVTLWRRDWAGNCSYLCFTPLLSLEEVSVYLKKRTRVLYAGYLAEYTAEDGSIDIDKAIARGKNTSDLNCASALIHTIRNIDRPFNLGVLEDVNSIEGVLWDDTVKILRNHAKELHWLAAQLQSRIKPKVESTTIPVKALMTKILEGKI